MSKEKMKCCARVYPAEMRFPSPRPCHRNASIERDGKWYCGTHDPVKKAERSRLSQQKWDKQSAERMRDLRLKLAAPELLEALVALYESIDSCVELTPDALRQARAAIKKATGEE